jgi:hypothetical protein
MKVEKLRKQKNLLVILNVEDDLKSDERGKSQTIGNDEAWIMKREH